MPVLALYERFRKKQHDLAASTQTWGELRESTFVLISEFRSELTDLNHAERKLTCTYLETHFKNQLYTAPTDNARSLLIALLKAIDEIEVEYDLRG